MCETQNCAKEYAASLAQQLHIATCLVIFSTLAWTGGLGVLLAAAMLDISRPRQAGRHHGGFVQNSMFFL